MRACESPLSGVEIVPGLCRWSLREVPHTVTCRHPLYCTYIKKYPYPCYLLDVFSRFLRNTNTSPPKQSAKCRNLLDFLQSEPWLRKRFDGCFFGVTGFLCLLSSFPEWKEEFSPIILPKPCNSFGACFGWCEPCGMCWGVIMPHAQRGEPVQTMDVLGTSW